MKLSGILLKPGSVPLFTLLSSCPLRSSRGYPLITRAERTRKRVVVVIHLGYKYSCTTYGIVWRIAYYGDNYNRSNGALTILGVTAYKRRQKARIANMRYDSRLF
jgi:hypothetical protein